MCPTECVNATRLRSAHFPLLRTHSNHCTLRRIATQLIHFVCPKKSLVLSPRAASRECVMSCTHYTRNPTDLTDHSNDHTHTRSESWRWLRNSNTVGRLARLPNIPHLAQSAASDSSHLAPRNRLLPQTHKRIFFTKRKVELKERQVARSLQWSRNPSTTSTPTSGTHGSTSVGSRTSPLR